jgi:DNA-directed RNA polymerase subunit RPC12/RpoP
MLPAGHTAFSHDLRVLLCQQCGAALPAPPQGGQVRCQYCGTTSMLAPRNEQAELATYTQHPRVPELERMQRLRMQDGRPLLPPGSLMHLLSGGSLPAGRVPEVLAMWNAARTEVAQRRSLETEERLFFLTLFLMTPLGLAQDHVRQRALLESASEALSAPVLKHQLRAALARLAVRAGDLRAAEAWLALCDPASESLQVDSDVRCARAMMATARGDFQSVLQLVGANALEVPIADSLDLLAGVLRANAYERLGRLDLAVQVLLGLHGQGHVRDDMEQVVLANQALALCPQSMASVPRGGRRGGGGGGFAGWGAILMNLPFLLITAGFFVAAAMVEPGAKTDDGYELSSFFIFMGVCFGLPTLGIMALLVALRRRH